MLVQDLMSTEVVTVGAEASLREAVGRLLHEGVGSVVVVDENGNPGGIVTETDALGAVYQAEQPPAEIDVLELTRQPVVTTKPETTVQTVARKMTDHEVKKVPVMDGLDLVGIVTLTDIVWHLSEIRKEATSLGQAHKEWDPTD